MKTYEITLKHDGLTPVIDALIAKGEGRATPEDLRTLDATARNP